MKNLCGLIEANRSPDHFICLKPASHYLHCEVYKAIVLLCDDCYKYFAAQVNYRTADYKVTTYVEAYMYILNNKEYRISGFFFNLNPLVY